MVGYDRWLSSKAPKITERAIDDHSVAPLRTSSFHGNGMAKSLIIR